MGRRRRPPRRAGTLPLEPDAPEYEWPMPPPREPMTTKAGEWIRWSAGLLIAGAVGWAALDAKTAVLVERVDQHYRTFDYRLQKIENALINSRYP